MFLKGMTRVARFVFFAIFLYWYIISGGVELINTALATGPVKNAVTEHVRATLKTEVSVERVTLFIGLGFGVNLRNVTVGDREKIYASAEMAAILLSPWRRIRAGKWLAGLRFYRPKIVVRSDMPGGDGGIPMFSLPFVDIYDPEVDVHYRGEKFSLKGDMSIFLRQNRTGDAIEGELEFNDVVFSYNDAEVGIRGPVLIRGRHVVSSGLAISSGQLTVTAAGCYTIGTRPVFHGFVELDGFRLARGSGKSPILNAILRNLDGGADFRIRNMMLYGIPVRTVTARATARAGVLNLQDLKATGDNFTGNGTITINPAASTFFNVTFSLKEYEMKKVLDSVGTGGEWIRGTMNLEGGVWGTGDSINGNVHLSSFNGRILRLSVVSKLIGALNLYKLMVNRGQDFMKSGLPYNSIISGFEIRDSVVSFKKFYLDSDSIQLSASGSYSMKENSLDALMGIHPLETVDRAIGMIPLLGWILKGSNRGFIVVYLKLKGPLDNIMMSPIPGAFLGKDVAGILLRTIMLPYTLFTRPQNLIPGLSKE